MKNAVFWDVAPCRSSVNPRIGRTYRLHFQGGKIRERGTSVSKWLQTEITCSRWFLARGLFPFSSSMKMEAIRSSETSVYTISTRYHIPEYGILHEKNYLYF
jgi:hypothetical protein